MTATVTDLSKVRADRDRIASYKRMAGLDGADLSEHMAIFPGFAAWLKEQRK